MSNKFNPGDVVVFDDSIKHKMHRLYGEFKGVIISSVGSSARIKLIYDYSSFKAGQEVGFFTDRMTKEKSTYRIL